MHALKGVTLQVARGELLCIMGPSGSGKSTLMNTLGLLDVPTSGTYKLEGLDVSLLTDDERAILRVLEQGGAMFAQRIGAKLGMEGAQALSCNALEAPAVDMMPQIGAFMQWFREQGAPFVRMSGSGSTVFAAFEDEARARALAEQVPGAVFAWSRAEGWSFNEKER